MDMPAVLAEGTVPDAEHAGIGEIVVLYASRSRVGTYHRCSYTRDRRFHCTCLGSYFHSYCWHITDLTARISGLVVPAGSLETVAAHG